MRPCPYLTNINPVRKPVLSNGNLKEVTVLQSSGYKILDDAACEVARKQAPYPPFPPQIDSQELWMDVPIVYKEN